MRVTGGKLADPYATSTPPDPSMIGPPIEPRNGEPKARSSKSSPSKSALVTLVPIIAFEPPSGTPSSFRVSTLTRPRSPRFAPRT